MTVADYQLAMRRHLQDAGFDFDRPDPVLAWTVFKGHASDPVECHDSYLFWEAADDYFDFVREFQHYTDNDVVWYEQLTIHFTRASDPGASIRPVVVFSRDHVDYDAFFHAVEGRPEVAKGIAFRGWLAELRVDGC
jgi:hypothetical protein